MSPRHAISRTALRHTCLTGLLAGAATTVLTAGPAGAAPRTGAVPARPVASAAALGADGAAYLRNLNRLPADDARDHNKMPTVNDVLQLALSQVGTTENAAGGSKFNQWFMSTPYAKQGAEQYGGSISDYANASWCDMFVSWVGDRLGVKGMGDNAFTPAHARWFVRQGRWGHVPEPGAVVFFSWSDDKSIDGIDHVGLVIRDNHDGTIQTVEGNTDNAVRVRTRPVSQVVGYGYPEYGR